MPEVSIGEPLVLPVSEYFSRPGLSNSAMKDLAVSPYRFWYCHINPNRPERRETPQMKFGSALHCAVLEPEQFDKRYACEIEPSDYPGCLRTMDDIREWLKSKGLPSSGKTKRELVERVSGSGESVVIYDVIEAEHAEENEGKIFLSKEDWTRAKSAGDALRSEPKMQTILADGRAEVSLFVEHPETGVPLKARMDWITSSATLDLKTFSQQRGKSIDKSIHDAIFYEGYYRQAYLYTLIRELLGMPASVFVIAFVESDPPHEVRIKALHPSNSLGQSNLYWERARMECDSLIATYAEYWERFGAKPWREDRQIDPLCDEQIPQLIWA